jgi:release factor H-coupled RctB family protein
MNKQIKLVKSENTWIEGQAIEQLSKTAQLDGILQTVGLPDLHPGKTPVGAVYLTKDVIYPHIIGNDIGCGLALFNTGIPLARFKPDKAVRRLSGLNSLEEIPITDCLAGCDLPYQDKLGTIGSGNHFAELQSIDRVYNQDAFQTLGFDPGEVLLLVHSGSRTYGDYVLNKSIHENHCQDGLSVGSGGFAEYMAEHDRAVNFAGLNRELIALRILRAMNINAHRKLLDSVHNSITIKMMGGEAYYIHRKGASPADQGFLVVAGTRDTNSYIVEPAPDLGQYNYSVSHGAGRKWPRSHCKERLGKMYSRRKRGHLPYIRSLIYRDENHLYQEAPEAYKQIEQVIEDMVNHGMIRLVASLRPLVTIKV